MKNAIVAFILLVTCFVSACATTGIASQTGPSLITNVTEGVQATEASGTHRTGMACSHNVLGIVTAGDSSVDAAKIDGDVAEVSSVDRKYINVLFLYGRACTIVKGK